LAGKVQFRLFGTKLQGEMPRISSQEKKIDKQIDRKREILKTQLGVQMKKAAKRNVWKGLAWSCIRSTPKTPFLKTRDRVPLTDFLNGAILAILGLLILSLKSGLCRSVF
jgi:hypothetical protein